MLKAVISCMYAANFLCVKLQRYNYLKTGVGETALVTVPPATAMSPPQGVRPTTGQRASGLLPFCFSSAASAPSGPGLPPARHCA